MRGNCAEPGAHAGLRTLARGVAGAAILALAACSSMPDQRPSDTAAPAILAALEASGVRDLRGSYRAALCRRLRDDGVSCDELLLRLPGEKAMQAAPPPADLARLYRVAFVPGLFADCVGPLVHPFADVEHDLARAGVDVHYLHVAGRGTSAANAERLARQVAALPDDPRPFIVFAYSKGLPDVLELVARHPARAHRITAIVSIAGAAQGSLLADELQSEYHALLSWFPLLSCAPGTGEEIGDLRREVRLEWWRRHRATISVPVFSLVTTPRRDRLTLFTATTYRRLALIDPRNDGALFWYDQIVPGSHLLGFVNADHWAVVARELPIAGVLFRDDRVPQTLLVEAAIEVVDNTLRGPRSRDSSRRLRQPHSLDSDVALRSPRRRPLCTRQGRRVLRRQVGRL